MKDALYECRIVYVSGQQIANGEPLNGEENDRLNLALKRIAVVTGLFNGKS